MKFLHGQEILSSIQKVAHGVTTRCAVPYISRMGMQLLLESRPRALQLVTQVRLVDLMSGAMCLDALQDAMDEGATIRLMPDGPRLHAKVIVSDTAVVGSANLTGSALTANIEAAVLVEGSEVDEIHRWMDRIWSQAHALTREDLTRFRRELASTADTAATHYDRVFVPRPAEAVAAAITSSVTGIARSANVPQVFTCNSGRRYQASWEDWMLENDVAAGWLPFSYPSSMEAVRSGDLVLLYRNRIGVIACGLATAPCRVVSSTLPRRFEDEPEEDCYEVPVAWHRVAPPLAWLGIARVTFSRLRDGTSPERLTQLAKALSISRVARCL